MIGPALILATIVGLFHVSAYVFIRGRAGARLPFLLVAGILGAWAGDTVGSRLAVDPIRIGEFNVVFASVMAWLAIGLVALLGVLLPERSGTRERIAITTTITRGGPGAADGPGDGGKAGASALPGMPGGAREPEPQAPQ